MADITMETQKMNREEVIENLKSMVFGKQAFERFNAEERETLDRAWNMLEERKQGKWIIDDKEHGRIWHCHCSNCKKDPQDYIGGSENWWLVSLPDYCPNCGAKMESEGVNDSN